MNAMTTKDTLHGSSRAGFPPSGPISITSICLDDDTLELVKLFVEKASLVRLCRHLADYRAEDHEPGEWIGNPPPDVCLLDFDKDRRSAVLVAERIHTIAPETAIFAVSSQSQPDSIIQAMRSGCSEYLLKPVDREQLLNAVARVAGHKKEKKETYKAQVMAFMGAKGGCGVTTLVTQLGALLANSYARRTLVVDFHPDVGDAALYLRLTNYRYHCFELMENTDRLDAELLQSFVVHHSSGLDLIPAPEETERARDVMPGVVVQTLDFLRSRYEFILVDLPPTLSDENLELIRYCDQLYLVTVAEVSAVRNVVRYLDYFARGEISAERTRIVLNRHQKRSLISDEQVEKVIRQKLFWKIPNQYAQVVKTINGGDPIGQLSSSEVTRNLNEWAGAIGKKPSTEDQKKENPGILGLWSR